MAPASSMANKSALTVRKCTREDTVDIQQITELDHPMALIKLESIPEKKNASSHHLLDLPAELRENIYECIAYDTTIQISEIKNCKHWPGLCFTSHQTYYEVLPILYRCAAFEATVTALDFTQIIEFTKNLPSPCLRALSCNKRLTVYLGDLHEPEYQYPKEMHFSIQPWLIVCWSLALASNDVHWNYQALMSGPFGRTFPLYTLSETLNQCGYPELRTVYTMLEDERMKEEVAGIGLALRSFAQRCRWLAIMQANKWR